MPDGIPPLIADHGFLLPRLFETLGSELAAGSARFY
jgi:hypothetical protein